MSKLRLAHNKSDTNPNGSKALVVGGIPFVVSILCLLIVTVTNLALIRSLIQPNSFPNLALFAVTALAGAIVASIFLRGRISTLLHEYRHMIVSGLAGNRPKKIKVSRDDSGSFEYAYTKSTARHNACISLAPYFFPFFLILGGLLSLAWYREANVALCLVGFGYGMDYSLNMRDISPVQSDLTQIRGGYRIGVLYVLLMNLTIFTILIAWVLQGTNGLSILALHWWTLAVAVVGMVRGEALL